MSEYNLLFAFIKSGWALLLNLVALPLLALWGYQGYARRWPATTGRYVTEGRVTELVSLPGERNWPRERSGLVSYRYRVDGKDYEAEMSRENHAMAGPDFDYFGDAPIAVYYSPKDPDFSFAAIPPSVAALVRITVRRRILFPMLLINLGGVLMWSSIVFSAHGG